MTRRMALSLFLQLWFLHGSQLFWIQLRLAIVVSFTWPLYVLDTYTSCYSSLFYTKLTRRAWGPLYIWLKQEIKSLLCIKVFYIKHPAFIMRHLDIAIVEFFHNHSSCIVVLNGVVPDGKPLPNIIISPLFQLKKEPCNSPAQYIHRRSKVWALC